MSPSPIRRQGQPSSESKPHPVDWPLSAPVSKRGYLIGDGFFSWSYDPSPYSTLWSSYTPLTVRLRQLLAGISPGEQIRGFSYKAPGKHYKQDHTRKDLLRDSAAVFAPYGPRWEVPVTYVAFSLAGPLFTIGLAASVASWQAQDHRIRGLLLVQPALQASRYALEQPIAQRYMTPTIFNIAPGKTGSAATLRRFTAAGRVLQSKGIPVRALIWRDDPILDYSPGMRRAMARAGIEIRPLKIPQANPVAEPDFKDAFRQHAALMDHPKTREVLHLEVAELLGNPIAPT